MGRWFHMYGEVCATHPWEVIVAVITFTTCLLTMETSPPALSCTSGCLEEQFKAVDVVVMTVVRCLAILYSSHQLRHLQKLGSKYILGLAGIFTVFSSFVFTSTVLNVLHIELVDLKDALFFFLLLIDLSKAATLAQFALTASNKGEISKTIARGLEVLGPTITLDTIVETLVMGVGTLSGVHRLEMLSYFACLSVLVNFVIFMTFYPACLSLMLELGKVSDFYGDKGPIIKKMLLEENDKANPALQRVKIIMSLGLMVVHVRSRWLVPSKSLDMDSALNVGVGIDDCVDEGSLMGILVRQMAPSVDHIVILVLLLMLIVKFVFFDNGATNVWNYAATKGALLGGTVLEESDAQHMKPKSTINRCEREIQTMCEDDVRLENEKGCRTLEECLQIYRSNGANAASLSDPEIILLVETKHIPAYNLESILGDCVRGVRIRRHLLANTLTRKDATCNTYHPFVQIPYEPYDYSRVMGACCENVCGVIPIPLGVAGPLLLDGKWYHLPMATTEGCLVASTSRGCRAVETAIGGVGVRSCIVADGMTRGPIVRFQSIDRASSLIQWLEEPENFEKLKRSFDGTSRFAKLRKISTRIAARYVYIRFVAETGDAMGMNMLSKGTERALECLQEEFPDMEVVSISGNYCTDKKPAAVNWIEGRGKSVVCEAVIPSAVVQKVLKTNAQALVELNVSKNLVGSAVAGSIGGFNAHAANIVTAMFIATGQDPAQNVASSNCLTLMELHGERGQDLYISCTMPSIELGTIGGGTNLPAQSACLQMLGVKGGGSNACDTMLNNPGDSAKLLARIICGAVLAGELSLMAALATGHLVKSHLQLNRSQATKPTEVRSSPCGISLTNSSTTQ